MSFLLDPAKMPAVAGSIQDYVAEVLASIVLYRVAPSGGLPDLTADVLAVENEMMAWWLALPFKGTRAFKFHPGWGSRAWIERYPPLPVWFSPAIQPGTGVPGEHYAGWLLLMSLALPQSSRRVYETGKFRRRVR